MIKINIRYSVEDEVKRIMTTIKDIDWFIKYGYSLEKLTFPKNLPIDKAKLATKDEIKYSITTEYNSKDYKKNIEFLENKWPEIESELSKKIQKTGINPESEYTICFTKYGTGGGYDKPNFIFVNIKRKWGVGFLRTVIHEMIHLFIDDLIKKYKIDHWQKERIVDLIFSDFFPELNKMQVVPIDTKEIDEIFKTYFPDIDKVLMEIGKQ